MTRIYTRTGDDGTTGLIGGSRAPKHEPRLHAIGEVDELNAALGVARAAGLDARLDALLGEVQGRLFSLGAELASDDGSPYAVRDLDGSHVVALERAIDEMETRVEPLTRFILPGGSSGASALHFARAVARRAERAILSCARDLAVRPVVLAYVNRLSDALFVAARAQNAADGADEVIWNR